MAQQPLGGGCRRHRAGDVPALRTVAAELLEARPHLLGLDALGHRFDAERVGEVDDRADDRPVAAGRDPADERAVHLDLAHRHLLEQDEGGVAGAEVVERQAHAESLQRSQRVGDPRRLGHEDALGELEPERGGRQPVPREAGRDGLRKGCAVEVAGRDVDGDRDLQPDGPPLGRLRESRVDDVAGESVHQARVLGEGDEVVGEDQAALRVAPPHQGLDAGDRPGRERDLRLVVQLELAVVDALAQGAEQAEPVGRVPVT